MNPDDGSPVVEDHPNPVIVQVPEDGDLPGAGWLEAWVHAALAGVPGEVPPGEVVVRVADEDEMAQLNGEFRGKDASTNVLSFPADLPPGPWEPALGDIVICPPVVTREAADQGKTLMAHWAHMVVHGTLHLLDYDHQAPEEAARMEGLERTILAGLGYGDPYHAEE